jgi:DNA-directed RNA polymerase specialized sigma24 family protein
VAGDEDQRERRFCRLYEANFRPVQAYAVNRLGRPDDVADVVAEVWEQLTYAEAAEALGCSVNAVGLRVHRAKERLRTLLGADSQADRPVPVTIKPNGVTDGS